MDIATLSRLLENLIRVGTIHSVDLSKPRVRVQTGRIVTDWLRWLEGRAGETTTWDPPTVGEQCIILSPSGVLEQGIVLRGLPSDVIDTPSRHPDEHVVKFPDGATFIYDHAASHLSITGIKTAIIVASESITHDTPLTHLTGKCVVDDLLTYNNGLAGYGGGNGSAIEGDLSHRDGVLDQQNVAQTNTGGSITDNGITLHTHRHEGVYPGGDTSGGPVA